MLPQIIAIAHGRTRDNFAGPHLISACVFSRQLLEVERTNAGKGWGPHFDDARPLASACIMLVVASIECYINEAFADRQTCFAIVDDAVLAKEWKKQERGQILGKYDLALRLLKRDNIDRGTPPAEDVALLLSLRNALVHFKPEWFDEQTEHARLSKSLEGRFPTIPFLPPNTPAFPRGWISHGCTSWAIRATIDFFAWFEKQAGWKNRMGKASGDVAF